jgi:S1-C subfamily serine protease
MGGDDVSGVTYGYAQLLTTVAAGGTTDAPPLECVKSRLAKGAHAGDTGFALKEMAPDVHPEAWQLVVGVVRPGGPAAKAGLQVGDIILTTDGHAVSGIASYIYSAITRAPEGTTFTLGLARGASVTITIAHPL